MIKKIFFSYSFANRNSYEDFHKEMKKYFQSKGVEIFAFVFDFQDPLDDHILMTAALNEIDKSDMVLVELSNKSVGVGLEAGYAKAKGKIIGYLYKNGSDLQQTVNGIADYLIPYDLSGDVISWFEKSSLL